MKFNLFLTYSLLSLPEPGPFTCFRGKCFSTTALCVNVATTTKAPPAVVNNRPIVDTGLIHTNIPDDSNSVITPLVVNC